jgi:hypothetical protein
MPQYRLDCMVCLIFTRKNTAKTDSELYRLSNTQPGKAPRRYTQPVCWAIRASNKEFGDICAENPINCLKGYGHIGEF